MFIQGLRTYGPYLDHIADYVLWIIIFMNSVIIFWLTQI